MSTETPELVPPIRLPRALPRAALIFAIAAALTAWNPLAAPIGVLVGTAALVMAARAILRRKGNQRMAYAAFITAAVAVLASLSFVLFTSGAWRSGMTSSTVVPGRTEVEMKRLLDEAAQRTAATRGQASKELSAEPAAAAEPRPDAGTKRRNPQR